MRGRFAMTRTLSLLLLCFVFVSCSTRGIISRTEGKYRVVVPAAPWYVEFAATNYVTIHSDLIDSTAGLAQFGVNLKEIVFSFTIEPAGRFSSPLEYRSYTDSVTSKIFSRDFVYKSHNDRAAFLEYDLSDIAGIKIRRHVFHAHYVRDGYRLMVTISAEHYRPDTDKPILDEIMSRIELVPVKGSTTPSGS